MQDKLTLWATLQTRHKRVQDREWEMLKPAQNVSQYVASAGGFNSYFLCSFIALTCFKNQYFVITEYVEPYIVRKLEMALVGLLKRLTDHTSFKLQNLFTVSIFSKNTNWQSLSIIITIYLRQLILNKSKLALSIQCHKTCTFLVNTDVYDLGRSLVN